MADHYAKAVTSLKDKGWAVISIDKVKPDAAKALLAMAAQEAGINVTIRERTKTVIAETAEVPAEA